MASRGLLPARPAGLQRPVLGFVSVEMYPREALRWVLGQVLLQWRRWSSGHMDLDQDPNPSLPAQRGQQGLILLRVLGWELVESVRVSATLLLAAPPQHRVGCLSNPGPSLGLGCG